MIKQLHSRVLPNVFFSTLAKNVSSSTETYVPPHREPFKADVEQLQEFLSRSERLFVLTGAGISTESGIPDYRSEGVGLYARTTNRPM